MEFPPSQGADTLSMKKAIEKAHDGRWSRRTAAATSADTEPEATRRLERHPQ